VSWLLVCVCFAHDPTQERGSSGCGAYLFENGGCWWTEEVSSLRLLVLSASGTVVGRCMRGLAWFRQYTVDDLSNWSELERLGQK
jgi:hypothetical protein